LFVDEWLKDQNGTRAYKHAYPNVKKNHTASTAALRLLNEVKVKAHIDMKRTEPATSRLLTDVNVRAYIETQRVEIMRQIACC